MNLNFDYFFLTHAYYIKRFHCIALHLSLPTPKPSLTLTFAAEQRFLKKNLTTVNFLYIIIIFIIFIINNNINNTNNIYNTNNIL